MSAVHQSQGAYDWLEVEIIPTRKCRISDEVEKAVTLVMASRFLKGTVGRCDEMISEGWLPAIFNIEGFTERVLKVHQASNKLFYDYFNSIGQLTFYVGEDVREKEYSEKLFPLLVQLEKDLLGSL
jgi:hypothetical protein